MQKAGQAQTPRLTVQYYTRMHVAIYLEKIVAGLKLVDYGYRPSCKFRKNLRNSHFGPPLSGNAVVIALN